MSDELPDLTGEELIKYLRKDGWTVKRRAKHGVLVMKVFADRTRLSTIPTKHGTLPKKTLSSILGPKQTNIGREGLLAIINRQ